MQFKLKMKLNLKKFVCMIDGVNCMNCDIGELGFMVVKVLEEIGDFLELLTNCCCDAELWSIGVLISVN